MKRLMAIFDDRRRAALALDFCADCIVLRHAPPDQDWAEIGAVALDATDFDAELTALREQAAKVNGGDLAIELWLPAQQVVNAYIPEGQTDPSEAISAQTGLPMQELVYDISPTAAGGSVACVAERHVVEEAQLYAGRWGFTPCLVTTRHADAAFAAPPVLAAPPRNKRRIAAWLSVAAAVLLVSGGAFWLLGGETEIEPPKVAFDKVATAPGRVAEPTPLADVLKGPIIEADQVSLQETARDALDDAPALSGTSTSPNGGGGALNFSLLTDAPVLIAAVLPAQPGGAPAQLTPVHLTFKNPGSAAPRPPKSYSVQEAPVVPPSPKQSKANVSDVALSGPKEPAPAPVRRSIIAPMTFAAPVALARETIAGVERIAASSADSLSPDPARPDRTAQPAIGYSPSLAFGAGPTPDEEFPSNEEIALALPAITPLTVTTTAGEGETQEASLTGQHEEILTDADTSADDVTNDAADVEAGNDLGDEQDTGPSDLAPSSAPAQKRRPEKMDMTPTEFAVLSAPAPHKRPASIIARPRRVDRPASAQRRIGPTGPALARAATVRDALTLDEVSLLGVFGSVKTRRALLRMPDGAVLRVAKGDVVEGWLVTSIERSTLNITRAGQAKTLKVPR